MRRAAQKQLDMELTMAGSSGPEAGGHLANGGHHLLDLYGDTGPGGRDHGEDRCGYRIYLDRYLGKYLDI